MGRRQDDDDKGGKKIGVSRSLSVSLIHIPFPSPVEPGVSRGTRALRAFLTPLDGSKEREVTRISLLLSLVSSGTGGALTE